MVLICSLKICRNVTGKDKFKAHRFPTDQNLAKKWLLRLREIQPSYEQSKSAVLCSAHFLNSDYTMFGSKKVLNKNVIPSIFKETACKSLLRVFEDIPQNIEKEDQNDEVIWKLPTNEEIISTMSDIISTKEEKVLHFLNLTNTSDGLQSTEVEITNDTICNSCSTSKELMSPTVKTSIHLKRKRKSYMGDFHETDLNSPGKRKRYRHISQNSYLSLRRQNKLLLSHEKRNNNLLPTNKSSKKQK